jgi:hypothetical protein
MRNCVICIMSLQSNFLGQTAVLRCERSATFQGLSTLWNIHTFTQLSAREDLTELCCRESCKTDITWLHCVSPGAHPGTLFWMQAEIAHTTYLMNRDTRSCAGVLAVYFRCHGYPGSLLLQWVSEWVRGCVCFSDLPPQRRTVLHESSGKRDAQ